MVAGLVILWRHAHLKHVRWSTKLHHVNETVPQDQWVYWDVGFLIWGAVMLIAGVYLKRAGRIETPSTATTQAV